MNETSNNSVATIALRSTGGNRQRRLSSASRRPRCSIARPTTVLIAASFVLISSQMLFQNVAMALLGLLLTAASFHDCTRLQVPNALTYPMILAGLALNLMGSLVALSRNSPTPHWLGAVGAAESLLGLLCGFGTMVIVFSLTGRGAGDVKLAAAIGALTGPTAIFSILVWTHLSAGLFVFVRVVLAVGPLVLCRQFVRAVVCLFCPPRCLLLEWQVQHLLSCSVPMAGFFAVGTLLSLGGYLI